MNSETIWAFDLGKGSIGEAVRQGDQFPHKQSLLIPADLARRGPATISGTPANRYRALKTREAHREREKWLVTIWSAAGLEPLRERKVWKNPKTGKWELKQNADGRLEREFAPKRLGRNREGLLVERKYPDGKARDGASAATQEDFDTCYTSCLLRIRLLQGDKSLAPWQIYKALRAGLQRRGYGPVPWATKEAQKQGRTAEELEREEDKKLQQADARYRDAVGKWPEFKRSVPREFHFPCYYYALKMGLWASTDPNKLLPRTNHLAGSTRNIRFDRADVRAELVKLGEQAATLLPMLRDAFARWQEDGWKVRHPITDEELNYPVRAKGFGEFFCDGPAGKPDETSFDTFLNQRRKVGVQRGSSEEWMAALGQKTPSFDNRALNKCVLIPRFHVSKVDVRLETDAEQKLTGNLVPGSLLATEVTFLLKLKNLLVASAAAGQRKLKVEEIRSVFDYAHHQLKSLRLVGPDGDCLKNWPGKASECFALAKSEWARKKALGDLGLRPMPGHEEVKAPKSSGRSAYSRVALRILKELILSGEAPAFFHSRLMHRDVELLRRLGPSAKQPLALFDDSTANDQKQRKLEDTENRKHGLLLSELGFLLQMRKDNAAADSWDGLFVPSQTLDALHQRHTSDGKVDSDAAICDLLGTINDPIVRHRLGVFAARLKKLRDGDKKEDISGFGVPNAIVLEFVREDFMGDQAKRDYQKFINDREKERKAAREEAGKLGLESRSSGLRYELWKAQACTCLYTGKPLAETELDNYEIDHIVPRSLGGPDATVNYVLTFHDVNHTKEKGKLTPFALLNGKEGWDGYMKRVNSCATALRNKKVQLADTSFGRRVDDGKIIIVKRVPMFDLAQEPAGAPGKTKFSLKYLIKKIKSVRDATIVRRLEEEFVENKPDEASWKKFCDSFSQKRKDGTTGARIIKVWVYAGEPDEFKDLSKDGTGAMRKAKDDHQGQIIYTDNDGRLAVKPVYAHASIRHERRRIIEGGGSSKVHCLVRSRSLFRLSKELPQSDYKLVIKNDQKKDQRKPATVPLPVASYMLNTIKSASMAVEFTGANGQRLFAPLRVLIDAGFEPV